MRPVNERRRYNVMSSHIGWAHSQNDPWLRQVCHLLKSGFDSFRIYAVKSLMIELFKILEGMTPDYLSELFVKADNPYDTRDKCKLIQPLKRTTTYGLRSFQYYGAHVWNMLPINIKAAQSLHEFKSFIRSWPGPTCSCHICTALL